MMYGIVLLFSVFAASTRAKITGTYPVVLTTTSGAPRPSGTGTDLATYPKCAQICGNNYVSLGDRTDIAFDCGPVNRGNISACEALVCNDADYLTTEALAVDRCGAYYASNPSASATASAAIASGTAEALAALATRDPLLVKSYPYCSQVGIPPALAANASNCLTFENRECICQCPIVYDLTTPNELATCSPSDLALINHLVDFLCAPVGGLARRYEACHPLGGSTNTTISSTGANGGSPTSPTTAPSSFLGSGARVTAHVGGVLLVILTTILVL